MYLQASLNDFDNCFWFGKVQSAVVLQTYPATQLRGLNLKSVIVTTQPGLEYLQAPYLYGVSEINWYYKGGSWIDVRAACGL